MRTPEDVVRARFGGEEYGYYGSHLYAVNGSYVFVWKHKIVPSYANWIIAVPCGSIRKCAPLIKELTRLFGPYEASGKRHGKYRYYEWGIPEETAEA